MLWPFRRQEAGIKIPLPYSGELRAKSPRLTIEMLYMVFCLGAFWIALTLSPLRHVTYLIPMAGLIVALAVQRVSIPEHLHPYMLLVGIGLMLSPLSSGNGWQDLYLMLIGTMPFVIGQRYRFGWWPIFFGALIGTAISIALTRFGGGRFADVTIDFMASKSSFESPFCFVFGMLAVWAVLTRRWREALVAVVFTILTLKRIALIGVVLSFALLLLPRRLSDLLLKPLPMIVFNATVVLLAVMYAQGEFDKLIGEWTNMSANQAGMGRRVLYYRPSVELTNNFFDRYLFIGAGAGAVYDMMKGIASWAGKGNLHCDVMKIMLEYGGIAFAAFFWLAYRIRSFAVRVLWFYVNVTMLTDNTLIYPFVIFAFGMIAMTADAEVKESLQRVFAKPKPPRPVVAVWRG